MFKGWNQTGLTGTFTFGAAENEYPHSRPDDFIRISDWDALETLLQGDQTRSGAESNAIRQSLAGVQNAFEATRSAFERLKEARARAGDARGALRPYKRPNGPSLDLKKIKQDNERQHALGAALLGYKLEIWLLGVRQGELRSAMEDLNSRLDGFEHEDIQLLAQHNILCASSLIANARAYVLCMTSIDDCEYKTLTGWISTQFKRLRQRAAASS